MQENQLRKPEAELRRAADVAFSLILLTLKHCTKK